MGEGREGGGEGWWRRDTCCYSFFFFFYDRDLRSPHTAPIRPGVRLDTHTPRARHHTSEAGPPPKLAHRPTADKPQQGAHGWDQVQAVQLAAPP